MAPADLSPEGESSVTSFWETVTGSQEASRPDFRTPVEGSSLVNLALVSTMSGSVQRASCEQVDSWETHTNNPVSSSGYLLFSPCRHSCHPEALPP